MNREEIVNSGAYQVTKAALEYYNEHHQDKDVDLTDAFEAGAEWDKEVIIEKACSILEDMTKGRLGKKFISEFKNKLKYGALERH